MKKLLAALSLAVVATSATANTIRGGLELVGSNTPVSIIPTVGDDGWGGNGSTLRPAGLYTSGLTGSLYSLYTGTFEATFLGKVATRKNVYLGNGVMDSSTVGSKNILNVNTGDLIDFSFKDGSRGTEFSNGDTNLARIGMLFLDAAKWNALKGTTFDFLIGFNDSAPVNADYDDYVVGVSYVPVPAALPLLASALGLFGLSRRKSKANVA